MAAACSASSACRRFAGFTAKFNVMAVLVANGGWWWVLVGVVGVNTVLSLYYYARVVKAMYLEAGGEAEATPGFDAGGRGDGRGRGRTCSAGR